MLIKKADDRKADIDALTQLLGHPQVSPQMAERIQADILKIRAGAKTEGEAAFDIDFHHAESDNWAVIHDLRIEYQGRVAQIDHLLISRFMEFWVCETKSFSQGVAINELGEFTTFYQGRPKGIASPIEQNGRHLMVLESVLRSSLISLPSRLGLRLQPTLHSVVLVGPQAHIRRPQSKFPGIETVIKSDQLSSTINRSVDQASGLSTMLTVVKVVSSETLEKLALQVVRLHRPLAFDWRAKFGLPHVLEEPAARYAPAREVAVESASPEIPLVASSVIPEAEERSLEKLPTSKLGARWGLRNAAQTLERLEELGYLSVAADGHQLTPKALACGAVFVEKGRYAPYFLWPADLPQ